MPMPDRNKKPQVKFTHRIIALR